MHVRMLPHPHMHAWARTRIPHAVVELLETHTTTDSIMWARGIHLVVEAHMMKDIQHNGDTFTVVKENHVIGILLDKD